MSDDRNNQSPQASAPVHGSVPFDDYPAEYWDENGDDTCSCCGGDGVVEYADHPEVWGEDCPSYENHLVPCPECLEREREAKRSASSPNAPGERPATGDTR